MGWSLGRIWSLRALLRSALWVALLWALSLGWTLPWWALALWRLWARSLAACCSCALWRLRTLWLLWALALWSLRTCLGVTVNGATLRTRTLLRRVLLWNLRTCCRTLSLGWALLRRLRTWLRSALALWCLWAWLRSALSLRLRTLGTAVAGVHALLALSESPACFFVLIHDGSLLLDPLSVSSRGGAIEKPYPWVIFGL